VQRADVELKSIETGRLLKQSSDEDGRFTFSFLPIGAYEIRVSANGFRTTVAAAQVRASEAATARFVLEVGQLSEVITVEGAVSALDTESPQMQMSLVGEIVQDLPVAASRDPNLLALISPGITPMSPINRFQGSGNYSSNGGRGRANNITMDGVAAVDVVVTGAGGAFYGLTMPQIAEVKLLTNNFEAEHGRNSSSQLIFLTKSGTNDLHGELYDYLQNGRLNSRTWFDRTGKPFVHKQNLYGFTAGGPVSIPRLYNGRNRKCWPR
jgi:hypothetical protein